MLKDGWVQGNLTIAFRMHITVFHKWTVNMCVPSAGRRSYCKTQVSVLCPAIPYLIQKHLNVQFATVCMIILLNVLIETYFRDISKLTVFFVLILLILCHICMLVAVWDSFSLYASSVSVNTGCCSSEEAGIRKRSPSGLLPPDIYSLWWQRHPRSSQCKCPPAKSSPTVSSNIISNCHSVSLNRLFEEH